MSCSDAVNLNGSSSKRLGRVPGAMTNFAVLHPPTGYRFVRSREIVVDDKDRWLGLADPLDDHFSSEESLHKATTDELILPHYGDQRVGTVS
jgi:hypothetical protein